MAYKALGWTVWQGGKWYLRRRYGGAPRKIAAGVAVVTGIGAFVAAQRRGSGES